MTVESILLSAEVEALLAEAGLPVSDLRGARGLNLFGIRCNGRLIGVIGIELHKPTGLLRSLVVAEANRGSGYGPILVSHAEEWASRQGVETLYLLTETAADFFALLGYEAIPRSDAPAAIAATAQFADLCPVSSTFMRKVLVVNNLPQGLRS